MKATQLTPALFGSERDSDGRLVALAFDSSPPLAVADANPWLVAVDSSENALRAIAHAAEQAGRMKSCSLHLVHVQPWLAKEAAEAELAPRALGATARARGLLDANRLPWRLHVAMGDAAGCILAQSVQMHATTLVVGSRGLNTVESLLFGSVAYKVMHLSAVPVLVVP